MIAITLINGLLVGTAVIIHYEALNRLSMLIPKLPIHPRIRVLFGVFGALFAHIVEMWVFAFGYYYMVHSAKFGSLNGHFDGSLLDCSYFSFVTYTSLGFGDITPAGNIRFLAGLEALTGLVLITWTASFMFIEMRKFWKENRE
jgi:hypothetical protein